MKIDFQHQRERRKETVDFEEMLAEHRQAVERFVKFRLPSPADAEDILQDVFVTAYHKREQLKNPAAFKPWLLSIARSKCHDYFRDRAGKMEIPLDDLMENTLSYGRFGLTHQDTVQDALMHLGNQDQQILYLFFWRQWPQKEIAERLQIPLGTVKSRLHTAKEHFKDQFMEMTEPKKGAIDMKKLPEMMPKYTIKKVDAPPFDVVCEESMGWLIIPRLGEKLTWGIYDMPEGRCTEYAVNEVVGRAEVHGIEGVEILSKQYNTADYYRTNVTETMERRFVAQLTDTHCRFLAESHMEEGVRKCYTFLDGEKFLNNWGYGENNCGVETHLSPKGVLRREGNIITAREIKKENLDVVGRYAVTINGKTYDTVCVMDVLAFDDAMATEAYLDCHGRTVLWRRFNKDDWAFHRYQQKWTEKLPDNERLIINGETYVHWYDCISDYIL